MAEPPVPTALPCPAGLSPLGHQGGQGGWAPSHCAGSGLLRLTDRVVPSSSLSPLPHKFIHMLMASGAGLCTLPSWATQPGWLEQLGEEQMKCGLSPLKLESELQSVS